jgi:hypothetical protein
MTHQQRIAELEKELENLTARLPRHSTPPAMLIRLEEVEEELAVLRGRRGEDGEPEREGAGA